jgi:hypothetical protein
MIPKIIWTYWHTENLPLLIEKCIQTWKFHNPDYKIHVLNENNFMEYCKYDIKSHRHYDSTKQALIADMIRLDLLVNHGGIWMDASIICLKPIKFKDTTSCFMYYSPNKTLFMYNKYPIIENWFIASSKHNKFIISWFNEFVLKMNKYSSIIKYKLSNHDGLLNEYISPYFAAYSAAQATLRKFDESGKNPNIVLKNAFEDGPYENNRIFFSKLNDYHKCNKFLSTKSPLIKLTSFHRKYLELNKKFMDCIYKKIETFSNEPEYMEDMSGNDDLDKTGNNKYPFKHIIDIKDQICMSIIISICIILFILSIMLFFIYRLYKNKYKH